MEVDSRLGRKFIIPRPFQLTTSRGGRQRWESTAEQVIFFNSRPLVEVDSWTSLHLFLAIFFNSRPLVEVDQLHCEHYTDGIFSTHDLSWRSTKTHHIITCNDFFSTHDLSWRSTVRKYVLCATCYFQLTTSRGDRQESFLTKQRRKLFNSRPLVEIDKTQCGHFTTNTFFNSRPLVEIDPPVIHNSSHIKFFQLTTSRGDRLCG